MPKVPDHVDLDALKREQEVLASQVLLEDDLPEPLETVAAFDAAYDREGTGYAALVVLNAGTGALLDRHRVALPVELPYIPGLLAFRELPLLSELWPKLSDTPDLLLVDGGGLIHPRRLGSACAAGLKHDVPAVGVAKSLLLGEVQGKVASYGDAAPIVDDGQTLGYALLSSRRAKTPIYVSPGHRVSPTTALELVWGFCTGEHKLPEPLYLADREAARAKHEVRQGANGSGSVDPA